ncbi:MAG: hypothetical protein ACRDPD_22915 [Streptosporangiaceae bacterium]
MDAQQLPDLLRLRGSVVTASDEFFAAKENLVRPDAPVFVPETYDAKGQVYDGWETRRRRGPDGTMPESGARDWVIVRLGVPGVVRSIVVDTAFFTGNYRGRLRRPAWSPRLLVVRRVRESGLPVLRRVREPGRGGWPRWGCRGVAGLRR